MGRVDELVSAEFAVWEQRGRGWKVWPSPVRPEPAFKEFAGYELPRSQFEIDDSRRPGLLASLFDSIKERLSPKPEVPKPETEEPEPVLAEKPLTVEFIVSLPASLDIKDEFLGAFLNSLYQCTEPIGFEVFGTQGEIVIRFSSSQADASLLQRQLSSFLPKVAFIEGRNGRFETWNAHDGVGFIVDFGLAHEFMLPLLTGHAVDPFVGIFGALSELKDAEVGIFQVLFQPVMNLWPGSVWRSVTDSNGKALFANRLELIPGTKTKLESPLFGVVLRVAAKTEDFERSARVVADMSHALRSFTRREGNRLIPLSNDGYPFEDHEQDLVSGQSRRGGMLLNRDELIGFVHLPSDEVRTPKLLRDRSRTRSAPSATAAGSGYVLGENSHAGRTRPVQLMPEQRVRHMHLVGASGTGKSTLLFNLIRQDIEAGQGVAVLDPHGDLVERILGVIPHQRLDDVIFFDPSDEEYSIGFNILSAHSDFEKNLLASDLVSIFRRLSSSWGDQLNSVLGNAIRAFLESSRGGTLADLRRFLIDASFRNAFLETVSDPEVVYYWQKAFPQLGGNKSIGPVLTRLETFLGPKPIRYMVSQKANRLDFSHILDGRKILLAKLSQGEIGQENSFLLGSLLMSKLYQTAMSRQRLSADKRSDFWLYLDEFHNFITPSIAEILAGARKYRLGLILAHQDLRQMERDREVASAVLSNCHTRVVFRVGDEDARKLADGFANFEARDLQSLGIGEAVCRVERSDFDFNLRVIAPDAVDADEARARRAEILGRSRAKYAVQRSVIEAQLRDQMGTVAKEGTAADTYVPKPTAKMPPESVSPTPSRSVSAPIEPNASSPTSPSPSVEQKIPPKEEQTPGPEKGSHQKLKHEITQRAEALDYRVSVEEPVPNGTGRVDLVLRRGSKTIACEVSVQNAIEYEVGNISKCLAAGFLEVVVVCLNRRHLERIQAAYAETCQVVGNASVTVLLLTDFLAKLEEWAKADAQGGLLEGTQPRKRSFNFGVTSISDSERRVREKEMLLKIAEAMKPKPNQPP